MKQTPGVRITDGIIPSMAGDYSLIHRQNGEDAWIVCPPKEGLTPGTLINSLVTVHEDGTISYENEISYNSNYPDLPQWRGRLTKGVWIEC